MTDEPTLTDNPPAVARMLLGALLADGPLLAVDVLEAMSERGFSAGQTKRAKKHLGVTSSKTGQHDPWVWALPVGCPTCGQPWPKEPGGDGDSTPEAEPLHPHGAPESRPQHRQQPQEVDPTPWCPTCQALHPASYVHCSACHTPSLAPAGTIHAGCPRGRGFYT